MKAGLEMSEGGVPTPAALRPPALATSSDPSKFGRVESDGTVILQAPEGEVVVGQWAAGEPAAGLAFFGRKYDDLVVEIDLIDKRLADHRAPAEQAEAVLVRVREALAARSFVGDVQALTDRCDRLAAAVQEERAQARARKAEQREAALASRRGLADEAESLRESTSWRATTERYAAIVEEWKVLPRGDRSAEQELWQRISVARTAFDKRRRTHFAELDTQRKSALGRKRELIASAEALSASTDWIGTSKKLRELMTDWKNAPRASRVEEDKLWKRFKAAQDAFYAARVASEEAEQEALRANLPAKEALVAEAEALLPVGDVKSAKSALRSIQDRYDKAGDLPRPDRDRLDGRLKKVEDAVRKVEADAWQRTNPTTMARVESTANAFTDAVARLEAQRDAAEAAGNAAKVDELEVSIANTMALLDAARNAGSDRR
jgi:hypothetical protein